MVGVVLCCDEHRVRKRAVPVVQVMRFRAVRAAAGVAGGRPPLLYRRGPATTLHPPLLRPAEPRPAG